LGWLVRSSYVVATTVIKENDAAWRAGRRCVTCGHLGTQHAYTSLGKRCIGGNWECCCNRRPMSLVLIGAVIPPWMKAEDL
jgi:hypothetical protein